MLYDANRHEQCDATAWDETRARTMIATIVVDTEARFSPDSFWPIHARDADDGGTVPAYPLYYGACGVIWALQYLEGIGATRLTRSYSPFLNELLARNCERAVEIRFRFRCIRLRRVQRDFPGDAVDVGFAPPFLGCFHRRRCFANAAPSVIDFAEFHIGPGEMR